MKIGFSLSRCVMDIYEGKVDIKDVFLIQSGTKIYDTSSVENTVWAYEREGAMWGKSEETAAIMKALLLSGKVYQPRVMGHNPTRVGWNEHWADIAPTVESDDENVKKAWNQYQMLLRLSSEEQPKTPPHLNPNPFDDNF